ncbi:MAG: PQQ-dependent sugar dehydrogenase [Vicinamibacterales bacterium]
MRTLATTALLALLNGSDVRAAGLRGTTVVTGLEQPVAFAPHPGDPTVWFVAQQNGVIWIVRSGVLQSTPFLNLAASGLNLITGGGERGLLGLAFPPDYGSTGRFYVNYTAGGSSPQPVGSSVVSRFRRSAANPDVADSASRFDLRWSTGLRHVVRTAGNHNGGCLAFGPDGYLYVSLGDSGGGGDPANSAQDPNDLRGKILRINVNVADADPDGFDIPADNPFVDGSPIAALPEIWSFGLRNPWKFTFDDPALGGTGGMLIGDVGQNAFEEIDFEPAGRGGRNYGWSLREGAHDYADPTPTSAAYLPLTDPVYDYGRSLGASVSGGYVYRGSRLFNFSGRYFFADFVLGRVWSFNLVINPTTGEGSAQNVVEHTAELGGSNVLGNISGFGVDAAGELYILNYSTGTIVRIDPGPPLMPTGLRVIG